MGRMIDRAGLNVDARLAAFIEEQALPGTGVAAATFWGGAAAVFDRFAGRNRVLLARRTALQSSIDSWHDARKGAPIDSAAYQSFLRAIGYLVEEPAPFRIAPGTLDPEIATVAGPQVGEALVQVARILHPR